MFYNCLSLTLLPDINKWNTDIHNLNDIINDCPFLIILPDISQRKTKNINMNSMYERNSTIIKLIYDIKDAKIIKIFHSNFVNLNKSKCKMIINNKIYLLKDKYQINEKNMKFIKIKLLILNNIKIDLSGMFYDCSSLKGFSIIYPKKNKQEEKLEEDKEENQTESLKSDDSNSQLYQIYDYTISNEAEKGKKPYYEYKSFNYIKQKYHNIYISNKNDISDFEKNKINRYYISSLNFLVSSFSFNSPEIQNNNIDKDNLNSQYSLESNISEIIKNNINTNESNNSYKYYYFHQY
jgi:hypothetical protein